ncbi:MAG: Asp-tRNA(Asn)/Glu-tRNA(Gln) amidotransferase subunit GatA [Planctomycetota bacterium]|nr:Asp-tRNA(Asn)/Glu-tRNA(Gln) amidotransferase subunit GatA [Planctomycetota bacterium]
MQLTNLTATQVVAGIAARKFSSEEVAKAFLDRTAKLASLNIYVHLDPEVVLTQARQVDRRLAAGENVGPLAGLPVAIKDLLCVEGEPTTCGSKMLANFRPPYDATVIEKLKAAGAVLYGKANMDEFAMGSSTENSCYGPTLNPWDPTRIPGGSSGGSAAAVAAMTAPVSLGSDTGGSIRQPAALCGVVGLKPTYGRVSRYGLIAFASSLDQIGPFTWDIPDMALLMEVISGGDPKDATSLPDSVPAYSREIQKRPERLRIGVVKEFFGEGLDNEVAVAVQNAIEVYRKLGAEIKDVSLPHSKYGIAAYYIVAPAEASSNLARYDGTLFGHRAKDYSPVDEAENDLPALVRMMMATRAEGFGAEVKRRIMLGTYALSAGYADQYYNKALKVRRLIRNDFEAAFREVDFLIGPTTPTPAFKLGEKSANPLAMYLSDIYTITTNLAGIPGLSMPCGLSSEGLPIGLQLVGPAMSETALLQAARLFERETDWHTRRPQN